MNKLLRKLAKIEPVLPKNKEKIKYFAKFQKISCFFAFVVI
jgi:hypothetical protein